MLSLFPPGNYGESGMEAFKDMAAKEGICIAHSGKKGIFIIVYIVCTLNIYTVYTCNIVKFSNKHLTFNYHTV